MVRKKKGPFPIGKKYAQRAHFKRRLEERLGITINRFQRKEIIANIKANRYKFLKRQSSRVTIWEIVLNGQAFVAVYDSIREELVTVLTMEMYKEKENDDDLLQDS